MSGATIHTNLVSAIRERLKTLSKATTGAVAALSAAGSIYTRSSGSFVSDGFGVGDEIVAAGFGNAANNGRACITNMTATTLTVDRSLTTESAGGSRSIVAGLPLGRAWEGEDYQPTIGRPYVADAYTILPSAPVGIGVGGVEAHDMQAIFTFYYPRKSGRLALSRMAGAARHLFRPGATLFYGGESGILMAASLNGRIVTEPHWLSATVTATVSARTVG